MESDFYTEFENNFRGSREQIMNVLSNYDGLIDYILNIDNDPSVLDIGSGRGEWIQKCKAKGFKSIGIELDPKMVVDCKKLNLNIQQGDALTLLDKFPEDSFSIVSAFHVIEHMNHENINKLLIQSKRILKPEGLLILETPSIDNIMVSSKSFHIDPTHINPIHPDLLGFMSKRNGFNIFKYYFINGGPLQNSEADSLTRIFNGVAQDLVLIASKSKLLDDSVFENFNLIKKDMNLGITSLEAAVDFDNYSRNRYAQYDESIFMMRKKIIDLERQLQVYISYYDKSLFANFNNFTKKLKRRIVCFKARFGKAIKNLLRIFLYSKFFLNMTKRIYKINYIFSLLRYLEKMLDHLGFRIYQYKFVKKSKKRNEDCDLVDEHTKYLETYYNSSQDAKNILKDLNKYS